MNKVKIEENLKIIVNNIMIYYDLKEYTRYVEQLYKGKMIGNINQAIEKYKSRLMTMENILKGQLTFMDYIAPILNRKSSSKYPNIVYNDVLVKDFYPNEVTDATLDEKIKLQHKLMIKLYLIFYLFLLFHSIVYQYFPATDFISQIACQFQGIQERIDCSITFQTATVSYIA